MTQVVLLRFFSHWLGNIAVLEKQFQPPETNLQVPYMRVCHTSWEYQHFKQEDKRVKSREEKLLLWLFSSPMIVTKRGSENRDL